MKHKFNKITTLALAAALTVGAVCATPVTARAAEGDDDFRDIVNSVWGDNNYDEWKDKEFEDDGVGKNQGGQTITWEEALEEMNSSSNSTPDPAPAPDPEPSTPSQSGNDDFRDIVDSVWGDNNYDEWKDKEFEDDGVGKNQGGQTITWEEALEEMNSSSNSSTTSAPASTATATPSQSAPAQPNGSAAPASAPVVSVTDAAGNVTAVKVTATAPVTDEAFLAAFPGATFVLAPNGFATVAVTDTTKTVFQLYYMGQPADEFRIMDAKNRFVAISAFQFVTEATGKTYVDVTIDAKTKKPLVCASAEQKAAFARLFGIDGVMINGELADEFVGDPALAN